jgi:hypothetical protein
LPPSTTVSPGESRPPSSSTTDWVAGRDHHPDRAGGFELVDQFGQAGDVGELGIAVVADDGVAGAADPLAHVPAHLAEADESQLHVNSLPE